LYEALGDQRRAAQQQANSAALRIEYGDRPADALRDMQNALAVFQKLGDKNFEAFCLQVIAAYYRQVGRHADAERELNRTLAILRERNLEDDIGSVTIDRARSQIDLGRYPEALNLLADALGNGTGPQAAAARIHLARVRLRLGDAAAAAADLDKASSAVGGGNELLPLLLLVRGELAYETGRLGDARTAFDRAASLWTGELPDIAIVETRANVGFLDAIAGRPAQGRLIIEASLKQAQTMERFPLEARCRLLLARIDMSQRRFDAALRALDAIPPDDAVRTIGAELRAQVHYWRAQALTGRGDVQGAQAELSIARKILEEMRGSLAETDRAGFAARPDIRRIIG